MTSRISGNPIRRPISRGRGFTLLEVLTTMAFLVVVMGLMVSLARFVRAQSAQQYTRHVLAELEEAQRQYASSFSSTFFQPLDGGAEEEGTREYVSHVNTSYIAPLLAKLRPGENQASVRDAWGNPIGFLASQNPRIGMAAQNQPFFFSAGPDGRYLSRQDNLYSYEQLKSADQINVNQPLDTANNPPATQETPSNAPDVRKP